MNDILPGQLRIWTNPRWVDCGTKFIVLERAETPAQLDEKSAYHNKPFWSVYSTEHGASALPESDILDDSKVLK
jgi:hypothetical protein